MRAKRHRRWRKKNPVKLLPPASTQNWREAHPEFYRKVSHAPTPTIYRWAFVSNEFISGYALWRRLSNVWACLKADSSVAWMLNLNADQAKIEALRRGCSWTWTQMTGFSPSVTSRTTSTCVSSDPSHSFT